MLNIDILVKNIHKDTNIDENIIRNVCNFLFKYTKQKMLQEDKTDILFNKLFKFKIKTKFKNEDAICR